LPLHDAQLAESAERIKKARSADRALFEHLKPWLVKANFSEEEIEKFVPYGQGTLSMTPALRALEVKLLGKQLRHGNHPILEMCAKNAKVTGDSGARKFDKKHQRGRIDGMVALAMACGVMPMDGAEPSVYETRGLLII